MRRLGVAVLLLGLTVTTAVTIPAGATTARVLGPAGLDEQRLAGAKAEDR